MIKTLDHLIVAVSDIDEAEKNYSKIFGADPVWRGEHAEYGTKTPYLISIIPILNF